MQDRKPDQNEAAFFFDRSAELLCVIAADGAFRMTNPAWQRLLGWSAEELCGAPIVDFIHPDDRAATRAAMHEVMRGEAQRFFINRYRGRDGAYRRIEWRFGDVAEDGSFMAIAQDVTEQQRRLIHAETVEQATGVGTWEIDVETRQLFWSSNIFRIFGLDRRVTVPTVALAMSHFRAEAREQLGAAIEQLLETGAAFDCELPFTSALGQELWVRATGMAEMQGGRPSRVFGTFRDITEERDRRLWLERLGAVAQHTTNTVMVLDRDLRIDWVNPAFEAQTGFAAAEAVGRRPSEVQVSAGAEENAAAIAAIDKALGNAESVRVELRNTRKDGSAYWVETNIEPVRRADGSVRGFISVETDITAFRHNAERLEQLERSAREARDRLLDAAEALTDAFVIFDADDRLVACNSRYREFYAFTAPVLVPGTSFEEIERYALAHGQLPDAAGREEEWLRERLAGRARGGATLIQSLPGGRIVKTVERRTRTGELVAFHADITELQRQREEAVSARNALQATLDAIPDLLFELDLDGLIVDARDGTSSRLDGDPAEYPGRRLHDILPEASADLLLRNLRRSWAHGAGPTNPIEVADGARWYEASIALKSRMGGPPRFLLTARDITERKAAEAAREQKEAELAAANAELQRALAERDAAQTRFFDIASVSRDWFWEQDADLRFTYLSDSVKELGGPSPEEHLGRTREDLTAGDSAALASADWAELRRIMAAREPFRDFVYRHPAGRDGNIWVRISGAPVFDAAGNFTGYRGVGSDVSALYEARLHAEEASAAKSRFLANMSHEIRTPLNGIMGMAAVLEENIADAEHRRLLGVIRDSGETLVTILNDILDFSKVEAGLMGLEIAEVSAVDLARRVESLHRFKAEEKGLTFRASVLPGARQPMRGDGHRILQILHNLVGNAIKFTDRGEIFVGFDGAPGALVIEVRDTGIGLDDSQLSRVFDEFVQGDSSTTRKHGGAGLGLSITRRLVELMDGTISFNSVKDVGTCVTVRLPLEPLTAPEGDAAPCAASGPQASAPPPSGTLREGLHALVADDNATNRLLMGKFLERLGMSARIVTNGGEAVQAAADEPFDVLLLDISMPDMTGIEALAAIRAADAAAGARRRPAVAVTANAMHHQVEEYMAAGFDGHVSKPISTDNLAAGIRAAVAGGPRPAGAP